MFHQHPQTCHHPHQVTMSVLCLNEMTMCNKIQRPKAAKTLVYQTCSHFFVGTLPKNTLNTVNCSQQPQPTSCTQVSTGPRMTETLCCHLNLARKYSVCTLHNIGDYVSTNMVYFNVKDITFRKFSERWQMIGGKLKFDGIIGSIPCGRIINRQKLENQVAFPVNMK